MRSGTALFVGGAATWPWNNGTATTSSYSSSSSSSNNLPWYSTVMNNDDENNNNNNKAPQRPGLPPPLHLLDTTTNNKNNNNNKEYQAAEFYQGYQIQESTSTSFVLQALGRQEPEINATAIRMAYQNDKESSTTSTLSLAEDVGSQQPSASSSSSSSGGDKLPQPPQPDHDNDDDKEKEETPQGRTQLESSWQPEHLHFLSFPKENNNTQDGTNLFLSHNNNNNNNIIMLTTKMTQMAHEAMTVVAGQSWNTLVLPQRPDPALVKTVPFSTVATAGVLAAVAVHVVVVVVVANDDGPSTMALKVAALWAATTTWTQTSLGHVVRTVSAGAYTAAVHVVLPALQEWKQLRHVQPRVQAVVQQTVETIRVVVMIRNDSKDDDDDDGHNPWETMQQNWQEWWRDTVPLPRQHAVHPPGDEHDSSKSTTMAMTHNNVSSDSFRSSATVKAEESNQATLLGLVAKLDQWTLEQARQASPSSPVVATLWQGIVNSFLEALLIMRHGVQKETSIGAAAAAALVSLSQNGCTVQQAVLSAALVSYLSIGQGPVGDATRLVGTVAFDVLSLVAILAKHAIGIEKFLDVNLGDFGVYKMQPPPKRVVVKAPNKEDVPKNFESNVVNSFFAVIDAEVVSPLEEKRVAEHVTDADKEEELDKIVDEHLFYINFTDKDEKELEDIESVATETVGMTTPETKTNAAAVVLDPLPPTRPHLKPLPLTASPTDPRKAETVTRALLARRLASREVASKQAKIVLDHLPPTRPPLKPSPWATRDLASRDDTVARAMLARRLASTRAAAKESRIVLNPLPPSRPPLKPSPMGSSTTDPVKAEAVAREMLARRLVASQETTAKEETRVLLVPLPPTRPSLKPSPWATGPTDPVKAEVVSRELLARRLESQGEMATKEESRVVLDPLPPTRPPLKSPLFVAGTTDAIKAESVAQEMLARRLVSQKVISKKATHLVVDPLPPTRPLLRPSPFVASTTDPVKAEEVARELLRRRLAASAPLSASSEDVNDKSADILKAVWLAEDFGDDQVLASDVPTREQINTLVQPSGPTNTRREASPTPMPASRFQSSFDADHKKRVFSMESSTNVTESIASQALNLKTNPLNKDAKETSHRSTIVGGSSVKFSGEGGTTPTLKRSDKRSSNNQCNSSLSAASISQVNTTSSSGATSKTEVLLPSMRKSFGTDKNPGGPPKKSLTNNLKSKERRKKSFDREDPATSTLTGKSRHGGDKADLALKKRKSRKDAVTIESVKVATMNATAPEANTSSRSRNSVAYRPNGSALEFLTAEKHAQLSSIKEGGPALQTRDSIRRKRFEGKLPTQKEECRVTPSKAILERLNRHQVIRNLSDEDRKVVEKFFLLRLAAQHLLRLSLLTNNPNVIQRLFNGFRKVANGDPLDRSTKPKG